MALRVWLPLNGNLENKGLSDACRGEGTLAYGDGKIGKALYMEIASAANGIYAPKQEKQVYTVALWFKAPGYTGARRDLCNEGRDYNTYGWRVGLSANENTLTMTAAGSGGNYTQSFTPDTWYHIAFCRDENKTAYYYVNGVLVSTKTGTGDLNYSESNGFINIGRFCHNPTSNSKLYPYQGYINDFRYYDECLSPKQVKEISKGLIAHYKLEGQGAGDNLFSDSRLNTSNKGKPSNSDVLTYCNSVTSYGYDTDEQCWKLITPNSGNQNNGIGFSFPTADTTLGIKHGDTITFSCEIKGKTDENMPALGLFMNFKSTDNAWWRGTYHFSKKESFTNLSTINFKRYSVTYTIPADSSNYDAFKLWTTIHGNYSSTLYIKNVKLEVNNKATDWIPNKSDILYTKLGYANDICTDASGNGYTATKKNTLVFNADSPRYNGSTSFSGTSLLNAPVASVLATSKDFTIGGWFKRTSGTTYYSSTSSSTVPVCLENARFFIYDSGGQSYVGTWSCTNNVWQHIVLVHDSTNMTLTLFVNGAQTKQITTSGTIYNREVLNIGGRNNGGQFNGLISDFRVYATVLSADDILTMYQTSGIIDNKNKVYAYEFKEK